MVNVQFCLRRPKYARSAVPTRIAAPNPISVHITVACCASISSSVNVGVGVGEAADVGCWVVCAQTDCAHTVKTKARTSAKAKCCFLIATSTAALAFLSLSANKFFAWL